MSVLKLRLHPSFTSTLKLYVTAYAESLLFEVVAYFREIGKLFSFSAT